MVDPCSSGGKRKKNENGLGWNEMDSFKVGREKKGGGEISRAGHRFTISVLRVTSRVPLSKIRKRGPQAKQVWIILL